MFLPKVYLRAYASVSEARAGIGQYLTFYNGRRPHSSLDESPPDQSYFSPPLTEAVAVIGGTALAGGVGTNYGAILGAFIMQALVSGMGMVGVDTPLQNMIVGGVLILAVWIDIIYRRKTGDTS